MMRETRAWRAGAVSSVAFVAVSLVLAGCGLSPFGDGYGETDYEGWAQQIVEAAGSSEITRWVARPHELHMTVRANGADTDWSAGNNSGVVTGIEENTPAATVSVDSIDWDAITTALEAIPEDCEDPMVDVSVMPAGQLYQFSECGFDDFVLDPTLDGEPIPDRIIGEDAAAYQQRIDILEPLIPGEVYGFGTALGDGIGGGTQIQGLWTQPNGEQVIAYITYGDDDPARKVPIIVRAEPDYLFPAIPEDPFSLPEYSFRPSDYPASVYADAIIEGRSQVTGGLPPDFIDFSATGPDQLAWAMMAGPVERVYGTIEK